MHAGRHKADTPGSKTQRDKACRLSHTNYASLAKREEMVHTCCSPEESEETVGNDGAPGSDTLLAASVLDLRASVGLGREGGLGTEGAESGVKPFTALAAAVAAASNMWQQLTHDSQCCIP